MECLSVGSFVLLLLSIGFSEQRTILISRRADASEDTSDKILFKETDRVVILDANNFESKVINNQNQAWLVEFYAHWCGYCIKFAPIWKSFARSVYNWREVAVIAVTDCGDKTNEVLCRDHNVTQFPTIRYFPAKSPTGFRGDIFDYGNNSLNTTAEQIRQLFTPVLLTTQTDGKGGPSWPNLKVTENLAQALAELPAEVKYAAVVFENSQSLAGTELILDYSSVKEVRTFRVLDTDKEAVSKYAVKDFPTLSVQQRGASELTLLSPSTKTRKGFYDALKDFLKKQGIQVNDLDDAPVEVNTNPTSEPENLFTDTVYQLDIEGALRHILFHELKIQKVFEGEKLAALQKFVQVLAWYFPLKDPGKTAFQEFSKKVINHKGSLTIEVYNQYLEPFESKADEYLMKPAGHVNCARSTAKPPCTLWILFHTLTVQASIRNAEVGDKDPQGVLNGIHGYVKNFFGCQACSKHFQEMATSIGSSVDSFDKSVLWLWRGHNEVNQRLAKEPGRVKIQFPSAENCRKCRKSGGAFNEAEVLSYMKKMYNIFSRSRKAKKKLESSSSKSNSKSSFNMSPLKDFSDFIPG